MTRSVLSTPRSWRIAGIFCLVGCASGASVGGGVSSGPSVQVSNAQGGDRMNTPPEFQVAQRSTVRVPIGEAWARLSKAYADLGIPLTTVQAEVHELGNVGMRRSHSLGNQRLSSLLECGSGGGGDNADTYSINMSVVSRLTATADTTTEIATLVQATASAMAFGSAPVVCSTKGSLEAQISSIVSGATAKK